MTEGIFHQANSLTYCCLVTDEVDSHAGRRKKVKKPELGHQIRFLRNPFLPATKIINGLEDKFA